LITTDDGADRYYLNQGAQGFPVPIADFVSFAYSYSHLGEGGPAADDGFGDETIAVDLNKDGWLDVLTFDVDFEFVGCTRRAHIYRNLGGTPGDAVTIQEQTTGSGCQNFFNNPSSCLVASIPADKLTGTYDIAVFDINGDSWDDLIIGRCAGTEIYISVPQGVPAGGVPDGDVVAGTMLTLDKNAAEISLAWGESCSATDHDFAVYEGGMDGGFVDHAPVTCSTTGAQALAFEPGAGNTYYLVVPSNSVFEGSYGYASDGTPRQQGSASCATMNTGLCE